MTDTIERNPSATDEAAARLRAVVETIVDGIITIDERGVIDFANPAAERMFGYRQSQLIGRNVSLLMPEPDASQHDGHLQNYLRTGVARIIGIGREVVGLRADGSTFPLELAVSEVLIDGRRLFTGVARDITERRKAEQMQLAHQAAEAASRAKSAFLSNMSHELRTPLTPILGYTELLLEDELSDDQREMIASIRRNSELLLQYVSRLLEMAAIDEGSLSVETEPCEPIVLARSLQVEFAEAAAAQGLRFDLETDASLPRLCWTDPLRARQILKLLLENAIEQTHNGGIRLVLRAADNQSGVIFDVIDTGCGKSQEKLAALFDTSAPFDAPLPLTEGLEGFKLSLAQRLAERIGGRLTADSNGNAGSRFSLHLPLAAMHAQDMIESREDRVAPPAYLAPHATSWQDKRVLIAEDARENQRLIQHMLGKHGIESTVASNGFAAVTDALLSAAAGRPFDLILMDIQMPGLDGWEATRRLRDAGLDTPIIALTALAAVEDQQQCLDAGCQDVITKPVSFARLTEVLRHWLAVTTAQPQAVS